MYKLCRRSVANHLYTRKPHLICTYLYQKAYPLREMSIICVYNMGYGRTVTVHNLGLCYPKIIIENP